MIHTNYCSARIGRVASAIRSCWVEEVVTDAPWLMIEEVSKAQFETGANTRKIAWRPLESSWMSCRWQALACSSASKQGMTIDTPNPRKIALPPLAISWMFHRLHSLACFTTSDRLHVSSLAIAWIFCYQWPLAYTAAGICLRVPLPMIAGMVHYRRSLECSATYLHIPQPAIICMFRCRQSLACSTDSNHFQFCSWRSLAFSTDSNHLHFCSPRSLACSTDGDRWHVPLPVIPWMFC